MDSIYDKIYLGKRKTSVARVKFYEKKGINMVNKREIAKYFGTHLIWEKIMLPFKICELDPTTVHFKVNVYGGGVSGQAFAIQNAIARFLESYNSTYKKVLKQAKMLSFSLMRKERKKCGLKKARKAPQFSKR